MPAKEVDQSTAVSGKVKKRQTDLKRGVKLKRKVAEGRVKGEAGDHTALESQGVKLGVGRLIERRDSPCGCRPEGIGCRGAKVEVEK